MANMTIFSIHCRSRVIEIHRANHAWKRTVGLNRTSMRSAILDRALARSAIPDRAPARSAILDRALARSAYPDAHDPLHSVHMRKQLLESVRGSGVGDARGLVIKRDSHQHRKKSVRGGRGATEKVAVLIS